MTNLFKLQNPFEKKEISILKAGISTNVLVITIYGVSILIVSPELAIALTDIGQRISEITPFFSNPNSLFYVLSDRFLLLSKDLNQIFDSPLYLLISAIFSDISLLMVNSSLYPSFGEPYLGTAQLIDLSKYMENFPIIEQTLRAYESVCQNLPFPISTFTFSSPNSFSNLFIPDLFISNLFIPDLFIPDLFISNLFISDLFKFMLLGITTNKDFIKLLYNLPSIFRGLYSILSVDQGVSLSKNLFDKAVISSKNILDKAVTSSKNIFDKAVTSSKNIFDKAVTSSKNIFDKAVTSSKNIFDKAVTSSKNIFDKAVTSSKNILDKGSTSFNDILDKGITSFNDVLDKGITSFNDVLGKGITSFNDVLNKGLTSFKNTMGKKFLEFNEYLNTIHRNGLGRLLHSIVVRPSWDDPVNDRGINDAAGPNDTFSTLEIDPFTGMERWESDFRLHTTNPNNSIFLREIVRHMRTASIEADQIWYLVNSRGIVHNRDLNNRPAHISNALWFDIQSRVARLHRAMLHDLPDYFRRLDLRDPGVHYIFSRYYHIYDIYAMYFAYTRDNYDYFRWRPESIANIIATEPPYVEPKE